MLAFQTFFEYGPVDSIAAAIASVWNRVEYYVGSGNLKYILLLALVILVLLLVRRRRAI